MLPKKLFFFWLPFVVHYSVAQNSFVELSKKADSLLYINPTQGLVYAQQAIQLLNPQSKEYTGSLLLLGRLQRESRNIQESIETIKKGLALQLTARQRINFLNEQAKNYFLFGKQDKRLIYLVEAWELSQELGLQIESADILTSLANHYTNQLNWDSAAYYFAKIAPLVQSKGGKALGDYHFAQAYKFSKQNLPDTSRYHYLAAIGVYKSIDLKIKAADVHRSLSVLESGRDQYSEALKHLEIAEAVYRSLNIEIKLANAYIHRAFIYRKTLQSELSLTYYNLALQIFREKGIKRDEAIALMNISDLCKENLAQPAEALAYIDSALAVLSPTNYSVYYHSALQQKAQILYVNQSFKSALAPLQKAYDYYFSRNDTIALFSNLTLAAKIYNKRGKASIAERKLLQAYSMIHKIPKKQYKQTFFEAYLANQIILGNKEKASVALEKLKVTQKAYAIETQKRQINDLQVAYETAQKEEQLAISKAKTKNMELLVEQQVKVNFWTKTAALIAITAAIIIFYFLIDTRRKNMKIVGLNKEMHQKNQDLDVLNHTLLEHNEEINSLNETLERSNQTLKEKKDHIEQLHNEMNHRIKNNLQSLSATFFLQIDEIEGAGKSVLLEAQNRIDAMGLLHKSLYHDEQNPAFINLTYYIEELLDNIEATYQLKAPIEKKLEIGVEKLDASFGIEICLMLNEMLVNAIKYAFPDHDSPKMHIKIYEAENLLYIVVKDNGPGLPESFSLKNAKSLGMKLINHFVKQHKGNCTIENDNGVKYTISFTLKRRKTNNKTSDD